MPDQKLIAAMEEIKVVIAKYDCSAVVYLSSPTHLEFLRQYGASWNAIKVEASPGGLAVRIKAKRVDFPSTEAHKECLRLTAGTVLGFLDAFEKECQSLLQLAALLGEHMEIEHITKEEPPRG